MCGISCAWQARQLAAQSLDQLSGRDATAGLKAALDKGAAAAVASLGRTDGFWANPKVRIPLPEQLQRARSALRLMGKGDEVDALELAVNRAAEQAVPQAKTLLTNAVKSMSVDDAKQILRGGDDSVTQFFKSKTAPQLSERFLPIVRQVTREAAWRSSTTRSPARAPRSGWSSPSRQPSSATSRKRHSMGCTR